ncbi:MAG TPA: cysteine--tRNA ligase [Actinomycetota bacterium]|jgi:cysteinyl-tRNA synthetase|nr:cysteine--tRNA ligase [Actinomycetota bacterium]
MLTVMRLFNTLTRQVEEVRPLEDGVIRMYGCGPTVYRPVHIGNLRTFLLYDLVRRALEFEGYEVKQVVNITDVGHMTEEVGQEARDRMDIAVADEGLSPQEIAEKYTKAFLEDSAKIGVLPAREYPKATDHIGEMIELTERLLERGHAYSLDDGTVYYDVQSFPAYGSLSRNTLDKLQPGHRQLEADPRKKHHADFSLWKAAGGGRVMKWQSPWGEGFPGWHIECSAMSMKYLGDQFDIHTGGVDLVFPHHEDEIAQSDGATGHQVIQLWVHGGHLLAEGQKMAKSTGNVWTIRDVEERGYDPLAFRFLCLQTRYRSMMDFRWDALEAADKTLTRIRQRMAGWSDAPRDGLSPEAKEFDQRFRAAVSNDLDMPEAVKVLNEVVSSGLADGEKYALLTSWDQVLGLDLERLAREGFEVPAEVQGMLEQRDLARAAGDFARADAIRQELADQGWEVMDTADGTMVRPLATR